MKANAKIEVFEYLMFKFLNWYGDKKDISNNDFSKLKVLKLLFFACAIEKELLNQFSFHAMPYGPVESSIYDSFEKLKYYIIDRNRLTAKGEHVLNKEPNINPKLKIVCDRAITNLRDMNENLVWYSASKLVDLTHMWSCWEDNFEAARSKGKLSKEIGNKEIIEDLQYFHSY